MDRGSYNAASGGLVQMKKLEIVNNNLANINTPGFKRTFVITEAHSFDETLAKQIEHLDPRMRSDHKQTPAAKVTATAIDFSPGPIKITSEPLDVALKDPKDFFVVRTPTGVEYTRAGNFTLNSEGSLVTVDGAPVVGDGGDIVIEGSGAAITPGGSVKAGRVEVGKLQVVHINDTSVLEPVGNTRFRLKAGSAQPEAVEPKLESGALEMSNVTAIGSVVDLITTNRAFDLYTRTARTIDELNQTSISQVGRRL